MNPVGIVEWKLTDIHTGELVATGEQKNTITDKMISSYFALSRGATGGGYTSSTFYVGVSTLASSADPSLVKSSTNASTEVIGSVPATVTSPLWIPKSGSTDAMVQYVGRFLPPSVGSTRTIRTVFLTESVTLGSGAGWQAYVGLNTACIQTDSQVLDVYYRITWPYAASSNIAEQGLYERARALTGTAPSTNVPSYGWYVDAISGYVPSLSDATFNCGGPFARGMVSINSAIPATATYVSKYCKDKVTISLGLTDYLVDGTVFNGIAIRQASGQYASYYSNHGYLSLHTLTSPNVVQPIHNHASSASLPFQDVGALATGSGSLAITSSNYQFTLPEYWRINIVNSGPVGTSTYKFQRRTYTPFQGNLNVQGGWPTPIRYNPNITTQFPANIHGYQHYTYFGLDKNHVVYWDATGVSVCRLHDGAVTNYDATSTPALPATNIVYVDRTELGTGIIYVACSATGIYKIDFYANTVTAVTVPSVTSKCYAISAKGSKILAMMEGGLAYYDGSSWTTYGPTSTPAFSLTGVTNSNWSKVEAVKFDASSSTLKCAIAYASGTATNFVWWTPGSNAVQFATSTSFAQTPSSFSPRKYVTAQWLECNAQGGWFYVNPGIPSSSYLYTFVFGNTGIANSISVYNNGAWLFCNRAEFVSDSTGKECILAYGNSANYTVVPGLGLSKTINLTKWVMYRADGTSTSYDGAAIAQNNEYYSAPWGGRAGQSCLLGNGLVYNANVYTNTSIKYDAGATIGNLLPYDLTNHTYDATCWETYGWNGSVWTLDNTNTLPGKPTHSTAQDMLTGLAIAFVDGTAGTSFVGGEYYTTTIANGVLKDNVSTLTFNTSVYYRPTITGQTDFTPSVVTLAPTTPTFSMWSLGPGLSWSVGSSAVTVDMAQVGGIQSRVISNEALQGDFEVSTTLDASANITNNYVNILCMSQGPYANGTLRYSWVLMNKTWYVHNSATLVNITASANNDVVKIARVGNTITFYLNGVLKHTATAQCTADGMYAAISPMDPLTYTNQLTTGTFVMNFPTIVSNTATRYTSRLGSSASGTGAFTPKFRCVDASPESDISIKLNGAPVAAIYLDGRDPGVNEVTIDEYAGIIRFNAADVGKAITGKFTTITN